jgi:serine phosphatase RsbU (regulator of sigma subunit)
MIRNLFFLLLILGSVFCARAQENPQELEKKLTGSKGKERFDILYELSKIYINQSPKKSIEYGKKAIEEAKNLNNPSLQADADNITGTAYYNVQNYKNALKCYEEELSIRQNIKQESSRIKTLYNIGSLYETWDKQSKAIENYQLALDAAKKIDLRAIVFQCYESIIRIYHKQKDFKNAYEQLRAYMAYKTLNNLTVEKIAILETQYKEEKKAKEQTEAVLKQKDSSLNVVTGEKQVLVTDTATKGKAINDLTIETKEQKLTIEQQNEKVRRQRQWLLAFSIFVSIIIIYSFLLYKQFKAKKKAHELLLIYNAEIIEQKEEIQSQADQLLERNHEIQEQKEEIQAQADELVLFNEQLTKQRDEILYQKGQITDSIVYASRIQNVMLPQQDLLDEIFPDNMVLWRPQEIVSGDFYWTKQIKNFVIFAAADCTGHGVPGAFMSMLGISFLNEIVSKSRFDRSNEILDLLRKRVKKALNQTGKIHEAADGMDIALCILDKESNILQYSGAYNPMYLIRDNQIQVFKADMQPIAIYPREQDFTYNEMEVKKDDCIYIFSDGYIDQFGGENHQKLKSPRFKELLLNIHSKPMKEQKELLNEFLENWMGEENKQIDDILIFGIKIQ